MFWQWLQAKLPAQMHNDISTTRNELESHKRKILVARVLLEPELAACKEDIQAQLKTWRATFLPLEVPFITWGRDFRIYDFNKTFTDICGCAMC